MFMMAMMNYILMQLNPNSFTNIQRFPLQNTRENTGAIPPFGAVLDP